MGLCKCTLNLENTPTSLFWIELKYFHCCFHANMRGSYLSKLLASTVVLHRMFDDAESEA